MTATYIHRKFSILLSDEITGGPNAMHCQEHLAGYIVATYKKAQANIEKRIARYEQVNSVTAFDLQYIDGMYVKEGRMYFCLRIMFRVRPALKLIQPNNKVDMKEG